MKFIHTAMLSLTQVILEKRFNKKAFIAANSTDSSGTHTGAVTYVAGTDLVAHRFVQFANPSDAHDRTVEYSDGTSKVIGVTLGSSDSGEAIGVHVFGVTLGSVKIETTGSIARLDKITPATDGKGIVSGAGSELSSDILAVALEGNDQNNEIECCINTAPLFA